MAYWLKLGYYHELRADPTYWRREIDFVADSPGRSSSRWLTRSRPRRGTRYPPFGPQYEIGDQLVMYLTETNRCPAILEVVEEPRWDPQVVDSARPGEGSRWAVVTPVAFVAAVPINEAPSLEDIGVATTSIGQKGHLHLSDWQFDEAEVRIRRRRRRGQRQGRTPKQRGAERVPIEEGHTEGYDVTPAPEVRRAIRRESRLVKGYSDWLRDQGDDVSRLKIRPGVGQGTLYSDVLNETRGQLVEAKAATDRSAIRMAIGQLFDYVRFADGSPDLAVLLEARPAPDLIELLDARGIAVIWRQGDEFTDNRNGAFV